ncbi:hypothetical protein KEM56_001455 [Ascosphaera pollenicola]|nr:hypothetical protein KEM56_001455 [Ascosphaera pollenicola]
MRPRSKTSAAPEFEDLNQIHDPKERRKVQNRLSQRKHQLTHPLGKRQKEQLHNLQAIVLTIDRALPGIWGRNLEGPGASRYPLPSPASRSVHQNSTPVIQQPLDASADITSTDLMGSTIDPSLSTTNWLRDMHGQAEPTGYLPHISPPGTDYSPLSEEPPDMEFQTPYEEFQAFPTDPTFSPGPVHVPQRSASGTSTNSSWSMPGDDGWRLLFPQHSILAVCPSDSATAVAMFAEQWGASPPLPPTGSSPRRFIPID